VREENPAVLKLKKSKKPWVVCGWAPDAAWAWMVDKVPSG
jgi:hypothetical protein